MRPRTFLREEPYGLLALAAAIEMLLEQLQQQGPLVTFGFVGDLLE